MSDRHNLLKADHAPDPCMVNQTHCLSICMENFHRIENAPDIQWLKTRGLMYKSYTHTKKLRT